MGEFGAFRAWMERRRFEKKYLLKIIGKVDL